MLEILAKIVESGAELDRQHLANLRVRVQMLLSELGLKSINDPMLLEIIYRAHTRDIRIPTHEGYPSREDFSLRYKEAITRKEEVAEPCRGDPMVSDLLLYARGPWTGIKGRGMDTVDYLYGLGKVLSHRPAYEVLFSEDPIQVNEDWDVENGRHRVLALKCLGLNYITASGMAGWIKAKLEQ